MLGSRAFLEGARAVKKNYREPVKEIYKNGSQEPGARRFLEGAESRLPNTDY